MGITLNAAGGVVFLVLAALAALPWCESWEGDGDVDD